MKKTLTLSNGVEIPMIGLGVFQAKDGAETAQAVKWALEAGYRHIDTAYIRRIDCILPSARYCSGSMEPIRRK